MTQSRKKNQNRHQAGAQMQLTRLTEGNQVVLFENGTTYFPAVEAAIDCASTEIYIETYIYENDATGLRIANALHRATLRGVQVHLLIDGFGSKKLPRSMLNRLRGDGIEAIIYRPQISPWTFRRKRLRRMHRKIIVVDRKIAFVGGINIIDDTETTINLPRYDYAVSVEGPLVETIRRSAKLLWSRVAWRNFQKRKARYEPVTEPTAAGGEMKAALLVRDNFRHRREIEAAYLQAIDQAQSEIIIANAYFFPGFQFRHALTNATRRGVRVVLLLQGKSDHPIQHHATRALYDNFLMAGIEIYENHKRFLHAKVAVVDGHWATVGSSNIDPFSLLLSREVNIVVDDTEFSTTLKNSLERCIATDAMRIFKESWKQQPAGLRFLSWLSYGLLRLMTGLSGYAPENIRGMKE